MSALAAIVYFDGRPVAPGEVESITATMPHRGPDGVAHWRRGFVALGQCMLRTTPESLQELQPLTNEDESLVLVMDGRVDNREDLKRQLQGKGAVLRDATDAELVLRAYEVWGHECTHHVIGECVFVVWDERTRSLFAGRDAAGARHFYYYQGRGWMAIASEIKGLLALPGVERRLNEERLLDYFVVEFDRIDEVGTFYQGISRLPAGHAMAATQQGLKVWRWWDPAQLSERKFASMDECAEAFLEQLREVVKCRLRSIKPVGAMLSGGLDSSTLVGLISKEFRGELAQPLRTFSMANADRDICLDWQCVQSITQADPWLQSTVITSDQMDQAWQSFVDGIAQADEPIDALYGWGYDCMHRAAGEAGCGSLFDGMAGDLLFHSPHASIHALASRGQWLRIPGVLLRLQRMGWSVKGVLGSEVSAWVTGNLPTGLLDKVRSWKDARAAAQGDLGYLHPELARQLVQDRNGVIRRRSDAIRHANDQQRHAANFKSGLISFAHESRTTSLLRYGVEPRSPYSDRRMMEFAVTMPMQAKLAHPWYKYLLRQVAQAYLPYHVVWRKKVGYHPGWSFHTRLAAQVISQEPLCRDAVYSSQALKRWVRPERLAHAWGMYKNNKSDDSVAPILNAYVLSAWLKCKNV